MSDSEKPPMKILFINEKLNYANATSYAYDLTSEMLLRGVEIQLCTGGGDLLDVFGELGVETYLVKWNILSFRKLLEFLRQFNPDLVHILSLRSVPFGQRIASKLEKPYVLTAHTRPSPDITQIEDPNVCGAIATSEVIRESLVNHLGIAKKLVRVIPRGIDLRRFVPSDEKLWTPDSGRLPVVGSVGRLTRDKGHHVLIEAARRVLDAGIEAHFAIVGEGNEESELRRLVKQLDLVPHVTFSPHIAEQQHLYGVFDIIAMPVLKTGVGVTAIETMAMRKPLIVSGVGEMLDLVKDSEAAILVREGDAVGLADAIIDLLRNSQRLGEIGARAREWVEKSFALEPMIDQTLEFYAESLQALAERMETT
jgi:glycosyltransferase involved in cell wall biosynthesis